VTLYDNRIAGALVRKLRWEQEWSVSTACSVYCRSNDDRNRKVFRSPRNISCDGASRTAAGVTGRRIVSHL